MIETQAACFKCKKLKCHCPKKLTKWEVGQVLVEANDNICTAIAELKDYPELKQPLIAARILLVKAYEENGMIEEMGFGI